MNDKFPLPLLVVDGLDTVRGLNDRRSRGADKDRMLVRRWLHVKHKRP